MTASAPKNSQGFARTLFLFTVLGFLVIGLNRTAYSPSGETKILLGNKPFKVAIADTPAARQRGLSGRPGLDQSNGMLFVFEELSKTCFWMKDMYFDVDILWFDQNQKLIYAKQEASAAGYPAESYCPPSSTKYVIEVAAGTIQRLNLKIGDTFSQP